MYERADEIGQEIALINALLIVTKDETFQDVLLAQKDCLDHELYTLVDEAVEEQKDVKRTIDDLLGPDTYHD